jgi:tetratricopeptide (TPR) repeat protein
MWVQSVHVGNDHYLAWGEAPQEVFDSYKPQFEAVFASIQLISSPSPAAEPKTTPSAATPALTSPSELEQARRQVELNATDPQAHIRLGNTLRRDGKTAVALEEYRTAIRLDRDNFDAHLALGGAYIDTVDFKKAEGELREGLRLKSDSLIANKWLAVALIGEKRYPEATAACTAALNINRADAVAEIRAVLEKPEQDELDRAPLVGVAPLLCGFLAPGVKETSVTESMFRDAVRQAPDFAFAHLDLAGVTNDHDLAIAEAKEALRLDPPLANAHIVLAREYKKENNPDLLAAEATAAMQSAPKSAKVQMDAARYLFRDRAALATAAFRRALALNPEIENKEKGMVSLSLAMLAVGRGDLVLANRYLAAARKAGADNTDEISRDFAKQYGVATLPDPPARPDLLSLPAQAEKDSHDALINLADKLSDAEDYEAAENAYASAQHVQASIAAELGLARIEQRRGNLDAVFKHLDAARRIEPDNPLVRMYSAVAYLGDRTYEPKATAEFSALLPSRKELATHAEFRVLAHRIPQLKVECGREAEGLREYEQTLEIYPDDVLLLNNTAWYYVTAKDKSLWNPKKALPYAQKAVKLTDEKNASFLDTLAEVYWVNGDRDGAIATGKKAIAVGSATDYLKAQLEKFEKRKLPSAANLAENGTH